ncbi:winged helix-turn-helix domain-containing protein [Phytohabitans sp. ZYX-F-186]|uniref:Winged helix-turn-helix domain-containing protein n=1 Tax=Phytohabitans maris TaxID=3071409 RepID=A0ABU0ZSF4_9ACTN|nr:winged helix-turn-helix domain-containing protein [Phytohabitans sp. ZYX-F-186]MDQ7909963.1 winged helix-turn-helix domain-containing protein [Phytohabitans sp. ZYX-F-186]
MVRLNVDRRGRVAGATTRADRVRVVVRRGVRGGGIHVTLAGLAGPASVPRLMQALRSLSTAHTGAVAGDALRLFPGSRVVKRGEEALGLTRREFDLLLFFVEHPRRVFTRAQLLSFVWGHEYASQRTVDVHIRRLRVKTGQPVVATVYRVGYRLHDETVAIVIRET